MLGRPRPSSPVTSGISFAARAPILQFLVEFRAVCVWGRFGAAFRRSGFLRPIPGGPPRSTFWRAPGEFCPQGVWNDARVCSAASPSRPQRRFRGSRIDAIAAEAASPRCPAAGSASVAEAARSSPASSRARSPQARACVSGCLDFVWHFDLRH